MFMNTHDKLRTNTTNRLSMEESGKESRVAFNSNHNILMPTALHHHRELPFLAKR